MSFFNTVVKQKDKTKITGTADMTQYFTKTLAQYTVPEGVTKIRSHAFNSFWPEGDRLDITLPSTLQTIEPYAFSESAIVAIDIPGNVKTIGDYAFSDTTIKELTLGEGIETIGDGAFKWGPNIANLKIPNSVKSIGKEAFAGMDVGSVIEIGSGVETIGQDAFDCAITSITIHRKEGSIPNQDTWFGGYDPPTIIWDGDK